MNLAALADPVIVEQPTWVTVILWGFVVLFAISALISFIEAKFGSILYSVVGVVITLSEIIFRWVEGIATWMLSLPSEITLPDVSPSVSTSAEPTPTPTPIPTVTVMATPPPRTSGSLESDLIVAGITLGAAVLIGLIYLLLRKYFAVRPEQVEKRRLRKSDLALAQVQWKDYVERFEKTKRKVAQAEMDWNMIFDLPALRDPSVDVTHRMHVALRDASIALDGVVLPKGATTTEVEAMAFPKAVIEFERAWEVAYNNAVHVGQSFLSAEEREVLTKMKHLVALATNGGATDAERVLAYQRIQALSKRLRVPIQQDVMLALESSVRPELTAGVTS